MMLMSLRSLVRSRWLWVVVIVLWVFALLGVFQSIATWINWGWPIAIIGTLVVAAVKGVEYLTRPAKAPRGDAYKLIASLTLYNAMHQFLPFVKT